MKSLSELRLVLGGLQQQVNDCVEYIDQLSGMMWGGKTPRRKVGKRVNGEAPQLPTNLRDKVKAHFHAQRSAAQAGDTVSSPANSFYITIEEAARLLHMSDNGVRFRIKKGELQASTEIRQTRTAGVGARPHKVMVVSRAAVAAFAQGSAPQRIPAGGSKGVSPTKAAQTAARKDTIRGLLAQAPRSSTEIQAQLVTSGDRLSTARVTQILSQELHARRLGKGNTTRWTLAGVTSEPLAAPEATKKRPKVSKIQQQRQRTLDYLALFDPNEPRRQGTAKQRRMLGALVRRGYLKEKGEDGGYVRTDREFTLKIHKAGGRKKR